MYLDHLDNPYVMGEQNLGISKFRPVWPVCYTSLIGGVTEKLGTVQF
jgi:hypothetical protein